MSDIQNLVHLLQQGDFRTIAKCITMVENDLPDANELLLSLSNYNNAQVIGITGPPGAGKSTLVNALLKSYMDEDKKVAVLSVDPSSPFNYGALLGDRIRMSEFYLNPNVYIRSLASRGSLGGLSTKIIEILDVLKSCPFNLILIETVGVGQSEVEISGLADTTIVVTVPEAGDEVQTMKAGVMEIADIFVVNKGDRENADSFVKNLKLLAHSKLNDWEIPVVKCIATANYGFEELVEKIEKHAHYIAHSPIKKFHLLTEKAYQLIQHKRMKDISKPELEQKIQEGLKNEDFNLYRFVSEF
ncbi:MAG TPA: methylmalonyl Co-A mutase-associated GTPase MeaB [Chitinophagaceae bacterium]|nr:methylmalonyl Co-A mutase-associated GTPase MeaB [Chitinophagaceae bacterium]